MEFLGLFLHLLFSSLQLLPSVVDSEPELEDCEWSSWEHVHRMRDVSDCRYFYHCIPTQAPFRQMCPQQEWSAGYYQLYYNSRTNSCDYSHVVQQIHPECFGTGGGEGGSVIVEPETTTAPPPTTKAPRPPGLNDAFEFEIDCSQRICGMFPNTYGECGTYALCVNGVKQIKHCNGGQLFDVRTKECQPAAQAECWEEPNAGPHLYMRGGECPFHGFQETTPIEELQDGTVILENPVVTNWGDWQGWEECPAGMYATGLYAWRRVLSQRSRGQDHMGIYSLSFRCQSPGGNETDTDIESIAPNGPAERWPFYYMCTGAVVGYQLNSVPFRGYDEIATDNVKGYCSCSEPVYKPYEQAIYAPQSGHRGDWTQTQFCKKHQAVCGMQTQMHPYRERAIGTYDNTGLNNLKIKCCNVPDPLENCVPSEERRHIRDCDNSLSDEGLRCDFDAMVGLTMDYESQQKVINFYSSVGYDVANFRSSMPSRIINELEGQMQSGGTLEYTWDDVTPEVEQEEVISPKSMFVRPFQKLELYQIVGKCGHFLVKSNRYLRLLKDASGSVLSEEYFEV